MSHKVLYEPRFYIHEDEFRKLCGTYCWFQSSTTREYDAILDEIRGDLSVVDLLYLCEKIMDNQSLRCKYDKVDHIMSLVIQNAGSVHFREFPTQQDRPKTLLGKIKYIFKYL